MAVAVMLAFIPLVLLIGGGILLIVLSRRGRRAFPSCGRCRYDMTGSIGTVVRCPECGSNFSDVGILPPGGGPKALAQVATGVVLLVLALGCVGASIMPVMLARASATRAQAAAAQQRARQQAQQQAQQQANSDKETANREAEAAEPQQ